MQSGGRIHSVQRGWPVFDTPDGANTSAGVHFNTQATRKWRARPCGDGVTLSIDETCAVSADLLLSLCIRKQEDLHICACISSLCVSHPYTTAPHLHFFAPLSCVFITMHNSKITLALINVITVPCHDRAHVWLSDVQEKPAIETDCFFFFG